MKVLETMVVAILTLGLTTGCPDGDDSCSDDSCDTCGNGYCGQEEHLLANCPRDCGYDVCGDGFCSVDEDWHVLCPEDCGSGFCGNGICDTERYEDCSSCVDDCGSCNDSGGDADADADVTACVACSVTGDWNMHQLFSNGDDVPFTSHFDQDGNNVVGNASGGSAGYCDYAGTNTNGSVSLRCTSGTWWAEYVGVLTDSSHMEGTWSRYDGMGGTWYGDRQP